MTLARPHTPAGDRAPHTPLDGADAARALALRITGALDEIQAHAAPCESLTALLMIGGAAADLAHEYADEHAPVPFALTP